MVTPFLPGDSLLFAAGAFAATATLNLASAARAAVVAAILGDTVNYWIGASRAAVLHRERSACSSRKHLDRTHEFFERHGGKTIILARFVPIIRTFAPFVAGIGAMSYRASSPTT